MNLLQLLKSMKRPCSYKECSFRRAHYERQDTARGIQYVEVPDDYPFEKKQYCSFTCAIMDGSMKLNTNSKKEE